jgi:hypothetical protein
MRFSEVFVTHLGRGFGAVAGPDGRSTLAVTDADFSSLPPVRSRHLGLSELGVRQEAAGRCLSGVISADAK